MPVKVIVLYTPPPDPEEFERHYRETHMPLVAELPGLQGASAARFVAAADGGDLPWYRTAELTFADEQAVEKAMASDAGRAVSSDFQSIAPPGSRLFLAAAD